MTTGSFPLTSVANLPNVTVAYSPGAEHWSNRRASGAIVPGEPVVPINSGGVLAMRVATSADTAEVDRLAIALRTVDVPDSNTGPGSLGPNEIRNQVIAHGDYVHAYYSGVFHLTLVVPDTYEPADRIGWDANGARPAGKTGTGAWAKNADADLDSIFEVMEWREINDDDEGILTVRWIGRTQA